MAAVIASIVWDVKNKLWFRLSPQIELGVFFWSTKGVCEQQGEQSRLNLRNRSVQEIS